MSEPTEPTEPTGPTMPDGWTADQAIDPAVLRAGALAWEGGDLKWNYRDSTIRQTADGGRPADGSYNSLHVVGLVERIDDLAGLWRELYRISAHAAQVRVEGPYWACVETMADPTRVRGLSEQMFVYLSAPSRVWMANEPGEDGVALRLLDGVDFEPVRYVRVTGPEWESRAEEAKGWALQHNINVCRRLDVTLVAYKPARSAVAQPPKAASAPAPANGEGTP